MGQFTNGVVSTAGMMCVVHPGIVVKNFLMGGQGMPPFTALLRGLPTNIASVAPAQGAAFAVKGATDNGFIAGCAAAPIATAFDRVMLVQQLDGKSAKQAILQILAKDGSRGFVKAFFPTLKREVIVTATLFEGKEKVEATLESRISDKKVRSAVASLLSGGTAGVLSAPADRVKTIMQKDMNGSYSWVQTTQKLWQTEGVKGFFKGAGTRGAVVGAFVYLMGEAKERVPAHLPPWMFKSQQ